MATRRKSLTYGAVEDISARCHAQAHASPGVDEVAQVSTGYKRKSQVNARH